ncbi:cold shock and DUF1294 domain-containing protein [Shewanella sp. KX20019]|uniref:cold shock and DUF1294 domain-containing protein n=1 Tax=Shewanella sp. KX20019 TaxID=2803864 RepID=UPI0019295128|nr:cold shock and DUF1294 domain-containing protein [Shewanella sp. KX20019]QQX81124.1 cold shock and DUF1294 domain-containing protein [Shewanella sp. KX20019]
MMQKGVLNRWNDAKGFGFITQAGSHSDVFVHISSFNSTAQRPKNGDIISFSYAGNSKDKPQARKAEILGLHARTKTKPRKRSTKLTPLSQFASAVIIAEIVLYQFDWLPLAALIYLLSISCVTFIAYALDKRAAKLQRWRVKESSLHLLAVLGGWPGALIAQQLLRHKSAKTPFKVLLWITIVLNIGVSYIILFTPLAGEYFHQIQRML